MNLLQLGIGTMLMILVGLLSYRFGKQNAQITSLPQIPAARVAPLVLNEEVKAYIDRKLISVHLNNASSDLDVLRAKIIGLEESIEGQCKTNGGGVAKGKVENETVDENQLREFRRKEFQAIKDRMIKACLAQAKGKNAGRK